MHFRRRLRSCFALCAISLALGAAFASAAAPTVEEGGWKGKTSQGYHVYFGARGETVANFRLTIREVICGKQEVHLPKSALSLDEAGHFEGALIPNRLEIQGTFLTPNRVKGTIVSLETTGLPGCTRKAVQFTAHPK
jgi:hypothetical protein